jgi:hypothetical protein
MATAKIVDWDPRRYQEEERKALAILLDAVREDERLRALILNDDGEALKYLRARKNDVDRSLLLMRNHMVILWDGLAVLVKRFVVLYLRGEFSLNGDRPYCYQGTCAKCQNADFLERFIPIHGKREYGYKVNYIMVAIYL